MIRDTSARRAGRLLLRVAVVWIAASGVSPRSAATQPTLDAAHVAGPLTVYPDAEVPGRFYYVPGPLTLAENDGHPSIRFLLTRRTGSEVTGDRGETHLFAHLTFDILHDPVDAAALDAARQDLVRAGTTRPELRLMPMRRTETQVVFAPIGGGAADTLPPGDFEVISAGDIPGDRRYTLRLDRYSAEAVWKMLEQGRTIVSFSYAYVAAGSVPSAGGEETGPDERTVRADAFEVTLNPAEDAGLIRVVDMNAERAPPPWHAVLDVRCYDFRNGLRPDLAMKMVDLEGRAPNGRIARRRITFRANQPDEAVHRLRYPFAVRMDEPLRYRVREILKNGEEIDHGWEERDWMGVLDVTSTPAIDDPTRCEPMNRTDVEECP